MDQFMNVPVRSVEGGAGTRNLAAGASLPLGTAPAGLIQVADGSAVVLANRAVTRPLEASAR